MAAAGLAKPSDPEMLGVPGSGEAGHHLLAAGEIGKRAQQGQCDDHGTDPVHELASHGSSNVVDLPPL